MFIDSHAHIEWESYEKDFDAVLQRAQENKVEAILNIGTTLEHNAASIALAEKYPHIYAAVGIHPHEVEKVPDNYLDQLKTMAHNPKVKAIGEVGLDYFYKNADPELQKKRFQEQAQLAKDLGLPLSIHCREAFQEAFEILDRVGMTNGVFHCFTGNQNEAQEALKRGFYISISGIITFKKALQLQDVVRTLPLEKLLIETDCPFLAPEPYRGKRNEPAYVVHTAQKIAELLEVSLEEVARQTTQNTKNLFQI